MNQREAIRKHGEQHERKMCRQRLARDAAAQRKKKRGLAACIARIKDDLAKQRG